MRGRSFEERLPKGEAGSSIYANELNFEPQDLDPGFDRLHEATHSEGANCLVQQTLMGAPEDLLLGSIDASDCAAKQGYSDADASTSDNTTQLNANPYWDATSSSPPPNGSVGGAALQATHGGALSGSGTSPPASDILFCQVREAGCACFCCKHRISLNDRWWFSKPPNREFVSVNDMLDDQWERAYPLSMILINLCSTPDCDRPHGIDRRTETSHLFSPQLCSDKDRYRCAVYGCQYFAIRRSDLRRHHAVKHCTQPKRFQCPEPYCKYGGENGFKRLDKLKDHQKKIHEGKFKPGQALRTIKSAATKPVTE